MKESKCKECGENRPGEFYSSSKSMCKSCKMRRTRLIHGPTSRAKEGYKEKQSKYYREWYAKYGRNRKPDYADVISLWRKEHPKAIRAWWMLQNALRRGSLNKSGKCEGCGGGGRINGHHKDYKLPYKVVWLCSSCHKKIHLQSATN